MEISKIETDVQTLFKFVSIRSPRREMEKPPLDYLQYERPSPFYQTLVKVKNQGGISATEVKTLLQETANEAANTGGIILDLPSLAKVVSNEVIVAANKLQRIGLAKETLSAINDKQISLITEVEYRLWDTLFHNIILEKSNEVSQSITNILKAAHIYRTLPKYEATTEVLGQLETLKLMLPEALFPLAVDFVKDDSADLIADINKKKNKELEKRKELLLAVERYQTAIEEIDRYVSNQLEYVRSQYKPITNLKPPVSNATKIALDEQQKLLKTLEYMLSFDSLSDETKSALAEVNASTKYSIRHNSQLLQKQLNKLTDQAWEGVDLYNKVVVAGGALWKLDSEAISKNEAPNSSKSLKKTPSDDPYGYGGNINKIRPLAFADFRRVEQELCCYAAGEVSHIDNILAREYKERNTRRLRRTENTVTTSTTRTEENLKDTTQTDRHEMQKETNRVIQEDSQFSAGLSVMGSYGPIGSFTANSNYSTSSSSNIQDREAVNYAKEVTERALNRIIETVHEERISKIIEEFEETNKHGVDNTESDSHIVGIYRWVDKIYKAKVINYGGRIVLEFMLTQPGAYHLWAISNQENKTATGVLLKEPIDPRSNALTNLGLTPIDSHQKIDESNYARLASIYGATVETPPAKYITVGKAYSDNSKASDAAKSVSADSLEVPEGYSPTKARVSGALQIGSGDAWARLMVGAYGNPADISTSTFKVEFILDYSNEKKSIPVSYIYDAEAFAFNVEMQCERSPEVFEAWEIKTFKVIITAYENKLAEYNQALAQVQTSQEVRYQQTNPATNRKNQNQEIKKGCINWLMDGANYGKELVSWGIWWFGHNSEPVWSTGGVAQNNRIKFFDQAIDWKLMTYELMPYFYGHPDSWRKLYQLENADTEFLDFLQAGMARVLVPVTPGFENRIINFLNSGIIFEGDDAESLVLDTPISLALNAELRNVAQKYPIQEGKAWEVRVPTSLTILQCGSGCVKENGLPCKCDEGKTIAMG